MTKPTINYRLPFCYLIIGPVGSGKSTVAKNIAKHPAMADCVVISTDEFVKERAAERGVYYDVAFNSFSRESFQRYVARSVREAVANDKSLIIDRCNLTRKSRQESLKFIPAHYNIVMVQLDWDEDKVLDRVRYHPDVAYKRIPIENVVNMFNVFQPPRPDECDMIIHQPAIYA